MWSPSDRAGRLTLAVATVTKDVRWIVVGDNSFLMSQHVVADPRPLLALLRLATLWPTFWNDVLVGIAVAAALLNQTFLASCLILLELLSALAIQYSARTIPKANWHNFYIGQSGFDESNFNATIAESRFLTNVNMYRHHGYLSGNISIPVDARVAFLLTEGQSNVGSVELRECRRLGSVQSTEGITIMDGQVCEVTGDAEILVGDRSAAAAFRIRGPGKNLVVILDGGFLSRRAPQSNVDWLIQQLK